jgi:hypothetical protein
MVFVVKVLKLYYKYTIISKLTFFYVFVLIYFIELYIASSVVVK